MTYLENTEQDVFNANSLHVVEKPYSFNYKQPKTLVHNGVKWFKNMINTADGYAVYYTKNHQSKLVVVFPTVYEL